MRVLVLDGNENQAVACVRSLARAGHRVSVGASTRWSKAGLSRFCDATFSYPSPSEDVQAFVARIAAETAREPGTLILPMTERTTLPLSACRGTIFAAGGRMVLPPHDTVLRAFDKEQTTRLANSLGIAIARTTLITDSALACETASMIPYPVVLKPRTSEQVHPTGTISAAGRTLYARKPREFLGAYDNLRQRCTQVLAQEFVVGTGCGYFALMRHGELRAEFAHRRIRDVRPTGSGSSVRVSVTPDPRIREAALAILRALKWHGVAMVEFRVRPDGTPVFLEVNGRFWNSLALAVYAGVDFPSLLVRMAEQGDIEPPPSYRDGTRCRWLLGDFRHLLEVLRGAPPEYPEPFPSRLRTVLSFLLPIPGTFHDNLELRDPLPELGDWLNFAVNQLPGAMKRMHERQSAAQAEQRA